MRRLDSLSSILILRKVPVFASTDCVKCNTSTNTNTALYLNIIVHLISCPDVRSLLYYDINVHNVCLFKLIQQGERDGQGGIMRRGRWHSSVIRNSEMISHSRSNRRFLNQRWYSSWELYPIWYCWSNTCEGACVQQSNCRRCWNAEPVSRRGGGCSFHWSRTANRKGWGVDFVRCQRQLHSLLVIIIQY